MEEEVERGGRRREKKLSVVKRDLKGHIQMQSMNPGWTWIRTKMRKTFLR